MFVMTASLTNRLFVTAALTALGAGCTVGQLEERRAIAPMESRSGSTVTGMAVFATEGNEVKLTLTVSGATAGGHAVHLHAVPDCSSPDANSAMGHWNPRMMDHGLPTGDAHHLGDCGNFDVGADGTGVLTITRPWSIGTGDFDDVIGHALIVHAAPDDGMTQTPPGNAGARQACGVVVVE
jgi:superoxide dismutase, Cu-Zn family